jgi:hypothetical protein
MKAKTVLILVLALAFQVNARAQAVPAQPGLIVSTRISTPLGLSAALQPEKTGSLQDLQVKLAEYDRQIAEMQKRKAAAVSAFFDGALAAESKQAVFREEQK